MRSAVAAMFLCGLVASEGCGASHEAGSVPDAASDVPDAAQGDPTEAMFATDRLLDIQIELAPSDWDLLRHEHHDLYGVMADNCPAGPPVRPYNYYSGTLTIDGETVEQVAVRKKGFLGSVTPTRPSLKLSFDEYVPDRTYRGLQRVTLNNNLQDDSQLNTCLAYKVFREAGVPAPRCNHARVTVNGDYLGIYSHVESVKRTFLARHFQRNDGNLYEGALSDFRPTWVDNYEGKPGNSSDRSDLAALEAALTADDANLEGELAPLLDQEAFMRFWAAELLVGHWDGYAYNQNNHYLYNDPESGQFHFIPWGPDATYGEINPFQSFEAPASVWAGSKLTNRFYNLTATRAQYQAMLETLLDDVWDETALVAEVDRMVALIRPHITVRAADFDASVDRIRNFINGQRQAVQASLALNPDWPVDLPSSFCWSPYGTAKGVFETRVSSFPNPNPFTNSTATLEVILDGVPESFGLLGANIGPDGNPADAKMGIIVAGLRSDGRVVFAYLLADPGLFKSNSELTVDMYDVFGFLMSGSDPDHTFSLGTLRGTLTLDTVGTETGETCTGSFDLTVYAPG